VRKEEIQAVIDFYLTLAGINHPAVKAHSIRVAHLSMAVGEALQKDSYACFVAGALHDVGKLLLPYPLFDGHNITSEEYAQIKEHVSMGYAALKNNYLFTALVVGLHHSMSKNGYGLTWKELPEVLGTDTIKKILDIATIISVCDFADAYSTRTTKIMDGTEGNSLKELLYNKFPNDKVIVDTVLLKCGEKHG
jgi:hypothetical protein